MTADPIVVDPDVLAQLKAEETEEFRQSINRFVSGEMHKDCLTFDFDVEVPEE